MKYIMIHKESDRLPEEDENFLHERYFEYATEEERDAQVAHDKMMFPGKEIEKASRLDDGEIVDRMKA